MKPVKTTVEILAFKALNRSINRQWVDWAVDMLMAGFNNTNLEILADESEPFNQFELQSLTTKVLLELNFDFTDKDKAIKNYICYLIDKALTKEMDSLKVLFVLKELYNELDQEKYLQDFYLLYYAMDDLRTSDVQWYWEGADKNNIDPIVEKAFIEWKESCVQST